MSSYTFTYPAKEGIEDVVVTGTFDNWSQSLPMIKRGKQWEIEVPLSPKDGKIEFKFILNNGEWVISDEYWTVVDDSGNVNNYIELNRETNSWDGNKGGKTTKTTKTEGVNSAYIPESGGLSAKIQSKETDNNASAKIQSKETDNNASATVMPSTEGIQSTPLGEPGIVVPDTKDPSVNAAFTEVSNVDAKALNAEMKAKEKSKSQSQSKSKSQSQNSDPEKVKYVKKVKKSTSPSPRSPTEETPSTGTAKKQGLFSRMKNKLK
ncbi:hypothetical protein JL09_g2419 [Pichia kudriavzevii]|uniref:AMP-activated protein kinase glycogen-binding domain-containing protein n=1 Tax=Pichia kudriavzevii TaxID=4909 RepID=A0A099P012_PICKU|nr:hypothetical protein JL09_g2419 [Pichia kudriavzevii]